VDAFWGFTSSGQRRRILPDGCMDFVFDLDLGTARLIGAMTRAEIVAPCAGTRLFGVRFLPGAAALLVDALACELKDQRVDLPELLHAELRRLPERMAEAKSDAERVRLLERELNARRAQLRADDRRLRAATSELRLSGGAKRVRELAVDTGVSERQLERLFQERVGVGPKIFARVMRLQRVVTLLRSDAAELRARSQAELALEAGYADESHLLRDFRELAAATPREVAREQHVGFVQDAPEAALQAADQETNREITEKTDDAASGR
jgi:AraC-like DNA-binding protein